MIALFLTLFLSTVSSFASDRELSNISGSPRLLSVDIPASGFETEESNAGSQKVEKNNSDSKKSNIRVFYEKSLEEEKSKTASFSFGSVHSGDPEIDIYFTKKVSREVKDFYQKAYKQKTAKLYEELNELKKYKTEKSPELKYINEKVRKMEIFQEKYYEEKEKLLQIKEELYILKNQSSNITPEIIQEKDNIIRELEQKISRLQSEKPEVSSELLEEKDKIIKEKDLKIKELKEIIEDQTDQLNGNFRIECEQIRTLEKKLKELTDPELFSLPGTMEEKDQRIKILEGELKQEKKHVQIYLNESNQLYDRCKELEASYKTAQILCQSLTADVQDKQKIITQLIEKINSNSTSLSSQLSQIQPPKYLSPQDLLGESSQLSEINRKLGSIESKMSPNSADILKNW